MKLKLNELVVASFETTPSAGSVQYSTHTCPVWPTPATECFVCPAPSSPEDGC